MRLGDKIWDGGWGAVILTVYSGLVLHGLSPEEHYLKIFALLPTILVMFTAKVYSTEIIDFFAGGELMKSTEEIAQRAGENFYEEADEAIQSRVDDLDQKAYRENVSILSGLVIALSAPILGFVEFSIPGLIGGILVAALAVQILSRKGVESLNELARGISRPYEAKHEN